MIYIYIYNRSRYRCVLVIRRRLYQYGTKYGDLVLAEDPGKTCDNTGERCSSGFIKTHLMQVFDSQLKDIKVT